MNEGEYLAPPFYSNYSKNISIMEKVFKTTIEPDVLCANKIFGNAYKHKDVDVTGKVLIIWSATFDFVDSGLEFVHKHVQSYTGELTFTVYNSNGSVEYEKVFTIDEVFNHIKEKNPSFTVNVNIEMEHEQLYIVKMLIDLCDNYVEVY